MKKIEDYNWTINRSVYNKLRKHYLKIGGDIRCSYCKYHKVENYNGDWYGGYKKDNIKYPNWKMVSKNRKQWMKKEGYQVIEEVRQSWRGEYFIYEVKW